VQIIKAFIPQVDVVNMEELGCPRLDQLLSFLIFLITYLRCFLVGKYMSIKYVYYDTNGYYISDKIIEIQFYIIK
jgi:hypothetical protein